MTETVGAQVTTQRWRLLLAYDGSGFHGFAAQPGQTTVAGALGEALGRVTRSEVPLQITCAGRTDSGVHARGQVVHVDLPADLPWTGHPKTKESGEAPSDLARALNRQLAPAIVVREAAFAPEDFDARRSATARKYRYLILNGAVPDPLTTGVAWHIQKSLDLRAMAAATDPLVGEHDYRAFCRRPSGTTADEPIHRRVLEAGWSLVDAPVEGVMLRFDIRATSFCHQMVRSIVATLVDAGHGKGNAATMMALLRSGSRTGAPAPAPAHGLCLVGVEYDTGAEDAPGQHDS